MAGHDRAPIGERLLLSRRSARCRAAWELPPSFAEMRRLVDRLTPHVHILEMNGESYRLEQSAGCRRRTIGAAQNQAAATLADNPAIAQADTAETSASG